MADADAWIEEKKRRIMDQHKTLTPFYTITDVDSTKTNSRSKRFTLESDATDEARDRIHKGNSKGVIILKAIKIVEPTQAPVLISEIGGRDNENPMAPDRGDLGSADGIETVLTREDEDEDPEPVEYR